VLYVCWSAGYNFRSGSEDAWLYDTTLTDGRSEDAFANVRGRGESIALAIGAAAAITGGYLGSIDLYVVRRFRDDGGGRRARPPDGR